MRRVIVAGVVYGLVAIGFAVWRRFDVANSQELLRSTEVVRVTRRDIGTAVKATGVIKPMTGAEVNVGSSVSGVVMRLFVQIGDHVKRGQPLAELDSRALTARRDADAVALRSATAHLRTDPDIAASVPRRWSSLPRRDWVRNCSLISCHTSAKPSG